MPYVPRTPLPARRIQESLEKLRSVCHQLWECVVRLLFLSCPEAATRMLQPWPDESPKSDGTMGF